MSSPFPGMDPYIERSGFFRTFHGSLINAILEQLNTELPPGYAAQTEEHVVIKPFNRGINPDVFISRRPRPTPGALRVGGAATLTPTAPHQVETLGSSERERYIEIRSGTDWDEIIAIIEVLSPTNKRTGQMRHEYLSKQQDILRSETHLIEIDLLRAGAHTVAAPIEEARIENNWHYIISSSLSWRRELMDYWPITIRESLPVISVPLRTPNEEVLLDLQAAFNRIYDTGPYPRLTNYCEEPPTPPFVGPDVLWIDTLLRRAGPANARGLGTNCKYGKHRRKRVTHGKFAGRPRNGP